MQAYSISKCLQMCKKLSIRKNLYLRELLSVRSTTLDDQCRGFGRRSGTLNQKNTTAEHVNLPDYNTSVNVDQHNLKRQDKTSNKRWEGLKDLQKRTTGSLIPETLKEMDVNKDFQTTASNLRKLGQAKLTRDERKKRQRALENLNIPTFHEFIKKCSQDSSQDLEKLLKKSDIEVLQLNIGLYCNQACTHCHVESSPRRKEMMSRETAERCLEILKNSPSVHTLDLTGGAPELATEFKFLAKSGRDLGRDVIDRCNLTALLEPGHEKTAEFLAENKIIVVASLPCYSAKNVNTQRGSGVFDKSIQALLMLNQLGYGKGDSNQLRLDLVYNPLGGFLPPAQADLESKYKEELWEAFGIEFDNLYTITNMPIKRFADFLYRRNELEGYMNLLVRNFNPVSMKGLMCRNHLNISWDGKLFDCDFNQQLDMPIYQLPSRSNGGKIQSAPSVWDINSTNDLKHVHIATDNHCFGCTAGMGSSCQGTTV